CPVNGPALALAGDTPVAAWTTLRGDALQVRVATRTRDMRWSRPIDVDGGTAVLGRVDVAPWQDDGFLLSWIGTGSGADDGAGHALRVAWFDADLQRVATVDIAPVPPGRAIGMPRL